MNVIVYVLCYKIFTNLHSLCIAFVQNYSIATFSEIIIVAFLRIGIQHQLNIKFVNIVLSMDFLSLKNIMVLANVMWIALNPQSSITESS